MEFSFLTALSTPWSHPDTQSLVILAPGSVSGQMIITWCSGQHPTGGQHAPLPEAGKGWMRMSHAPLWNAKYKQGIWFMSVDTEYYWQLTRKCLFMSGPGSLFTSLIEAGWEQSFWSELLLSLQELTPHIRHRPVPRKLYSTPPILLPTGSPTPPPTQTHTHNHTLMHAHEQKFLGRKFAQHEAYLRPKVCCLFSRQNNSFP